MKKRNLFLAGLLLILKFVMAQTMPALAQEQPVAWQGTQPIGKFLSDTLKIGYPIGYSLSLKHPADMEVIFPDSSFQYAGFEWLGKDYFPTRTDESGSLDSVVYTLASFSLDSVQYLSLPIYIITQTDCTAVFAKPDSVYLHTMVHSPPDSLAAKTNLNYVPVRTYYNYGYTLLLVTGIVLALLLINLAFGKRIRKLIKLYSISREHSQFRSAFDRFVKNVQTEDAVGNVENAVILWKNYMESLENKPFSTYTTKEIIEVIPNQQLAEALQHTDRIIYGQMASEESIRYTRILAYVAKRSYIEKRAFIEKQKV
ncbi:hypothetical protein Q0590_20495 [Rhodocytophaga aerolata]|uniref:DUF4129 domain-containing protein n=1 Tax=Rhodocytophaga aerolata TaxID=455078 RepID=A0ABT8R996_9BACT|nr:hypothetical protein [Rhodocytophaga aerolata]MDO1448668.1 hypothetical protein [Rhodocytophaga aerolata]